jgi:hypothetical protein
MALLIRMGNWVKYGKFTPCTHTGWRPWTSPQARGTKLWTCVDCGAESD